MTSKDIYSILSSKPHNPHYLNRYWKFINSLYNQEKQQGVTEHHHICPQAKNMFPEYSSLKENEWNGIHLTKQQHFLAHWMLAKTYNNSQLVAVRLLKSRSLRKLPLVSLESKIKVLNQQLKNIEHTRLNLLKDKEKLLVKLEKLTNTEIPRDFESEQFNTTNIKKINATKKHDLKYCKTKTDTLLVQRYYKRLRENYDTKELSRLRKIIDEKLYK